uniref:Uncharacterized protein n=1 Tax=Kalanchoe fedtschenkoi TaxID=63787 RepID=A0A7N1A2K4_KALFE
MRKNNEKPPSDVRIYIVIGLFFICIVGGGVLIGVYVFVPDSPLWYAVSGIFLVGVPWTVWALTYIYSCMKIYRNALAMDNNVGRVFPHLSQRSRSFATATTERTSNAGQSPTSPAPISPNGNRRLVQFGGAKVLEDDNYQEQEDGDSYGDDADGKKVEYQMRGKENKGKESEIPHTSSASS